MAVIDLPPENAVIRHSLCDICTPGPQCGVDLHVQDGVVTKLEGTDGFPGSGGRLCAKGAAGRQYLYREDRIRTPMRRVGPRGSGRFEPISWDEALDAIADALSRLRTEDPDSVVWLTGYPKWYRPFLHRLAHRFGTENYITESSACHQAEVMSYKATYGALMNTSPARANTILAWGVNAPVNAFPLGQALFRRREQGARIVVIDPRRTQSAELLADLYLRPRAGTDGALAHAMAFCILSEGRHNEDFLRRYVHGFEEYRTYVSRFTPELAEGITGVPAADIRKAARWLAEDPTGVVIPSNALTHRITGFTTHRAVLALMILLGRVDCPGGVLPVSETFCHSNGGFRSREEAFIGEARPANAKPAVGTTRFPLWGRMVDEGQGMDLIRQAETGDPYPLRAFACFGVNHRMYPESRRFLEVMDRLDFSFAADIFWTDVCRHADIVLPVCTSYERSEIKCYGGRFVYWTQPAVAPLYDSRPDTDIIFELSRRLNLGDPLLDAGYDACIRYIFAPAGITDWDAVKAADGPVSVPNAARYEPGSYLSAIPTPSGRIELMSEAAAALGYPALPEYIPAASGAGLSEKYPFTLITGGRLAHAIHSRCHEVPWLRSLRPEASADMNPEDAKALGVSQGDEILLRSSAGEIRVRANISEITAPGEIGMYHGYREANVNELMPLDHLDPVTGFPGYKQLACAVIPVGKEATP